MTPKLENQGWKHLASEREGEAKVQKKDRVNYIKTSLDRAEGHLNSRDRKYPYY